MKYFLLPVGLLLFATASFCAVELISLEASNQSFRLVLQWSTASELNNSHFELTRDGIVVATVQGAGNSANRQDYWWADTTATYAHSHTYNLVAVDVNGHRDSLRTVTGFRGPVDLMSFTAAWNDAGIQFSWTTAAESNNDHFDLVRNGVIVTHVTGAGDSPNRHDYSWSDQGVLHGESYQYYLVASDINGGRTTLDSASFFPDAGAQPRVAQPASFGLAAYPNPFNSSTVFTFTLPNADNARLSVFDLSGREVRTVSAGMLPAGEHRFRFDASGLTSGAFFVRLQTGGHSEARKLIFLK